MLKFQIDLEMLFLRLSFLPCTALTYILTSKELMRSVLASGCSLPFHFPSSKNYSMPSTSIRDREASADDASFMQGSIMVLLLPRSLFFTPHSMASFRKHSSSSIPALKIRVFIVRKQKVIPRVIDVQCALFWQPISLVSQRLDLSSRSWPIWLDIEKYTERNVGKCTSLAFAIEKSQLLLFIAQSKGLKYVPPKTM